MPSLVTGLFLATLSCVSALPCAAAEPAQSNATGIFEGRGNIGEVVNPGVTQYDAAQKTYTITAGGENMWSTQDAFYFLWKKVSGDVEISAEVNFPHESAQPHRKAVLILRQDLAADGAYADAAIHGSGMTALQYRQARGAVTHDTEFNIDMPQRVRLVKRGDEITMFLSMHGEAMHPSGAAIALHFDGPFYAGIGVCSHDKNVTETAVFSSVEMGQPPPEPVQRPKITGVSHLSVYSSDASKAEYFYVHDLGATKQTDPQSSSGVRYAFNPIQFVEVLPLPAGAASINRLDHAAFNTVDGEGMRKYLEAYGVDVPSAVTPASDGSRYFEVKDPEGNRVEFVQLPEHPAAVPGNPLSTHIIHVGYIVHNPSLEDIFYRGILGFRPYWQGGMKDDETSWISQQVPDGSDWIEYMAVKGPEKTGIPASMSQETAGVLDHFALGVPNVEKAMNLLYEGGRLTMKHSPPQIGRDGKWQLNLYDPDGIRAELMEFQPSVKPCCSPFLLPGPTE